MLFDAAFLDSLPRFVTPLLLAALAGAICHRAAVFNIALEGMMLIGAFSAVAGAYASGSWIGGVAMAMLFGGLAGLAFAWFSIRRGGDDIVVSIGMNFLAIGSTIFMLRLLFDTRGQFDHPGIIAVPKIPLPFLDFQTGLSSLLSNQSVLFWFGLALTFAITFLLRRHRFGLQLRAAGENPEALKTAGLSPNRIRSIAVAISGVLCGLAGAQLSISNVTLFTENMSAGRGWIAVVIVLMCNGRPLWILPTAILFGLIEALGFRIQGLGLPQQFTDALPYVVALVVLAAVLSRKKKTGQIT